MTTKQALDKVANTLSDDRLRQLLDFAQFLSAQEERDEFKQIGLAHLAKAYGSDEPEYTEADIKARPE